MIKKADYIMLKLTNSVEDFAPLAKFVKEKNIQINKVPQTKFIKLVPFIIGGIGVGTGSYLLIK